ncbi:MAG: ABC transporter permease [Verrucomicrobia bacterium]|nr:ABC transporter permease [Verrucomicrobiota bacterium]
MQTSPPAKPEPPDYEIHIEARTGWLRVDWREFWEYRDLLFVLVRRDFLAKYKQTVLGPLWFIVQPLLNTLVFTIVFNKVAGIATDGIPPLLFYLCALLPWGYFAQNVTTGAATFTTNAHLFGKVYFPRLIVPVSSVISNLFALGLQFVVFFVFAAWFGLRGDAVYFGPAILLSLPLLLITAALSLGLSLLISSSTAKYRDLSHLTPILIQLWMFATPVIYPLSKLTGGDGSWAWIAWMNPMAPVVEGFRYSLLGRGTWQGAMLGVSAIASVIILFLGIVAFGRAERTVTDSA